MESKGDQLQSTRIKHEIHYTRHLPQLHHIPCTKMVRFWDCFANIVLLWQWFLLRFCVVLFYGWMFPVLLNFKQGLKQQRWFETTKMVWNNKVRDGTSMYFLNGIPKIVAAVLSKCQLGFTTSWIHVPLRSLANPLASIAPVKAPSITVTSLSCKVQGTQPSQSATASGAEFLWVLMGITLPKYLQIQTCRCLLLVVFYVQCPQTTEGKKNKQTKKTLKNNLWTEKTHVINATHISPVHLEQHSSLWRQSRPSGTFLAALRRTHFLKALGWWRSTDPCHQGMVCISCFGDFFGVKVGKSTGDDMGNYSKIKWRRAKSKNNIITNNTWFGSIFLNAHELQWQTKLSPTTIPLSRLWRLEMARDE